MRALLILAVIALLDASTAHAGKRLTTGPSGFSAGVQCSVVNTSESKTLVVRVIVRNSAGIAVSQSDQNLSPLTTSASGVAGSGLWCEFVVLSGGSAKDVRATLVVYDPDLSTVGAIEPAREK